MRKTVLLLALVISVCHATYAQVNIIHQAPNGVTTTQVRAPNGLSTYAYLRACALVLQPELTNVSVNGTINAFGFTLSTNVNVASTGNFTVYLENTNHTTYQKGSGIYQAS